MTQVVTTTVQSIKTFEGTSQQTGKPWTKYVAVTPDGEFATFRDAIGEQLPALQGKTATFVYKTEQRGQYTNNVLEGIAGTGDDEAVNHGNVTPITPAQPKTPEGGTTASSYLDKREERILRQSALSRAIAAFDAAGLNPVTEGAALLDLAEEYKAYFENGV